MRALWISRINAATRSFGISYSKFVNSLSKKSIILDRKILSDIAICDSATFKKLVDISTK
jgi:large subunit ribosomal protein L20